MIDGAGLTDLSGTMLLASAIWSRVLRNSMANEVRDKIYMAALKQEWPCIDWVAEHKFHPERQWRFDFAAPAAMVAIEIEGGVWTAGRHIRGAGFIADCVKYNAAASRGWKLIRVTPKMMEGAFPQVVLWIDGCLGGLADV